MPVYSLSSHCCDVSLNTSLITNSIQRINRLFMNDTLALRDETPELLKLQNDNYTKLISILEKEFGIILSVSDKLFSVQDPANLQTLIDFHSNLSQTRLICLEMLSSLLKSTGLAILTLHKWISVREALKMSRLEERYQTSLYGQIEEFHVFDEVSILMNSLAASTIWDLND